MNFRKFAFGALLAATVVAGSSGYASAAGLQEIKSKGVLIAGVKADYRPFGYRASNGEIVGIEPDLAKDVADRLGVKVQFVPVVASNRTQFLQQGKIDMIIATMADLPERDETMGMVRPDYYSAGINLMLPEAAKITSWEGIRGRKVCAIQGANYNRPLTEKYGAEIVAFAGSAEALNALQQGRCVGFYFDESFIAGKLLESEWKGYGMPLPGRDPQAWALAVRKGDQEFKEFMVKTVEDWHKTGKILELETKYGLKHSKFVEEMHDKYKSK